MRLVNSSISIFLVWDLAQSTPYHITGNPYKTHPHTLPRSAPYTNQLASTHSLQMQAFAVSCTVVQHTYYENKQ